tara:strand:+ start:319 stop:759 length:441 start_codon:yes stop_codon:yes gene_type:complete
MQILTNKNALLTFGIIDLIRGFLHTVNVEYASEEIAGLVNENMDKETKNNIYMIMNAFGTSNLQTGVFKLLIALKKVKIEKQIFLLQFILFLFNNFIIHSKKIDYTAKLPGKKFMSIYSILSLLLYFKPEEITSIEKNLLPETNYN